MAESPDDDAATVAALDEENARLIAPLDYWSTSSEPQDHLIRQFLRGVFCYATTANRAGKTEGIGAGVLALCQGRESLQGERGPILIPRLKPPVVGLLAGESYKAMSLSSVKTLRKLLGSQRDLEWKEEHAGNPDYVSLFRIKHRDSRSEREWSLLYVFPYDGALPEGAGLDFWWCDEPPPYRFVSVLGSRVESGHTLRQIITATPQEKAEWYPISKDFADVGHNGHLTRWPDREVRGNRMRIKWKASDNRALTARDRQQLEQNARGKAFERAILFGEEVDINGGCPWPMELLQMALDACRPPIRTEVIDIEGAADGTQLRAILHVYEDYIEGDPYYVVGDPAKGPADNGVVIERRDPDGMHVRNRRTDALCARLVSRIGAWALGNVMADMHERYGGAKCDPLITGGYGIATVQALRKRGVWNYVQSRIEVRPGEWAETIGTTETVSMRQQIVEGVEREILTGKLKCPAAEVIQSMMDTTVDENGRVVALTKKHLPEDLACWGRYAVFSGEWDAPEKAKPAIEKWVSPFDSLLEKSLGYKPRQVQRRIRSRSAAL